MVESSLLFSWAFSQPANAMLADDQVMLMAYQAEAIKWYVCTAAQEEKAELRFWR